MSVVVNESELISGLKRGSEASLKAIYDLYAPRLLAFCIQYTKSRSRSEEIVQDAFVWLWFFRSKIRQENSLRSLLFIRVKHFLINEYRSVVNHPLFADYLSCIETVASSDGDPMMFDEFLQSVSTCIDSLPSTQGKVIRMSRLEGYKNKEIAEALDLSEQTVKNQVSMGLKTLRLMLKEMDLAVLLFILFI